jgi:23S rRNA pseudouridine2605 synthase
LIDQGKILVNGEKIESYGQEVQEGDEVKWRDGEERCFVKTSLQSYDSHLLLFHKPIGYVCSKSDPHNHTIYELLPSEYKNRYYIGRLDKDTHGLLLLTNDSKLVDYYEHPRNEITKEYLVKVNKLFRKEDIAICLKGMEDA